MTSAVVSAPQRPSFRLSATLKNFWIDILLFMAFVVDMNVPFTGISIHEWLGIGLIALFIYHLILHWDWISAITRRFLKKLPANNRLKYAVDLLLYVDIVLLIASGIWISEAALPQLGLSVGRAPFWRGLHHMTADWAIWLSALHLALNWKWIANSVKRYMVQPIMGRKQPLTEKSA